MSKTTVIYRKWKSGSGKGVVIALFPRIEENAGRCLSYKHIGQHGIADYDAVIGMTEPAQPEEYSDLKAELEQIGYRLRIAKRNSGKVKLESDAMMSMLHMKLVWRVDMSEQGCDIKTDAGPGGPLFHICRVGRWLCNDDEGYETAVMIAKSHNEELKRELRQAYKERWQSELTENASFYVTRKGMTLAKLDAGYKINGEIDISSGELLACDPSTGDEGSLSIFITLGGLRGVVPHATIPQLLDDGVLANY